MANDQETERPFLTPRCRYVLNYTAEQTTLRLDQVQRLMGRAPGKPTKRPGIVSEQTAMRRIRRWEQKGMVMWERPFTDEPGYLWLTSHGLSHCPQDYSYVRPSRGKYLHLRLCTELRMHLEGKHGGAIAIRSERLLRKLYHVPKGAVAKQTDSETGPEPHIVDLEVVKREGGVAAIEVELSLKGRQRLQAILTELAERYSTTYYYVVPKTKDLVQAEIGKLPAEDQTRFEIRDLMPLFPDLAQNVYVW